MGRGGVVRAAVEGVGLDFGVIQEGGKGLITPVSFSPMCRI